MKAIFTPSLITGDATIDGHHRELFKRANDLFAAIEADEGTEKVQEVLGFLADYTTYHFSAEEEMMKKEKYPKIEDHKAAHAALVNDVKELSTKLVAEGPTVSFESLVHEKVVDWLYNHIKGCDHDFIEYKNIRYQQENML
jgi:hemerythrin